MTPSVTVIYYTSNKEDPGFEARIREQLRKAAELADGVNPIPIVSVSQKPIDFGENICVGEVGFSDANILRQMLIAARAAKTDMVLSAESDCLYPVDYFRYRPEQVNACYRYRPVWMLWKNGRKAQHGFFRKEWTEGGQLVGRDLLIERLEMSLAGRPEWSTRAEVPDPKPPFAKRTWLYFGSEDKPMISIKTGDGLRPFTGTVRDEPPVESLPYWGKASDLHEELWGDTA